MEPDIVFMPEPVSYERQPLFSKIIGQTSLLVESCPQRNASSSVFCMLRLPCSAINCIGWDGCCDGVYGGDFHISLGAVALRCKRRLHWKGLSLFSLFVKSISHGETCVITATSMLPGGETVRLSSSKALK